MAKDLESVREHLRGLLAQAAGWGLRLAPQDAAPPAPARPAGVSMQRKPVKPAQPAGCTRCAAAIARKSFRGAAFRAVAPSRSSPRRAVRRRFA